MKFSVKLILWEHDKNKQHQCPIYLKVTINRKTRYMATGYDINKKYWLPKSEMVRDDHANASTINSDIADRKQKALNYIVQKNILGELTSASEVKTRFAGNINLANFFEFTENFIKELKGKRAESTLENYRKHTDRLKLFTGSIFHFEQFTHEFLLSYEAHLKTKVKENYMSSLWKTYKTIFNSAIKKGITKHYPFNTYENPKYSAPGKEFISLKEMSAIEEIADKTTDYVLKQTAIYFLLGCYTGLRISDWYKFDIEKNVRDNQILLRATKNKEWISMPVSDRFKRNLKRMQKVKLTIEEPTINRTLKDLAIDAGINKHLSTHCARHSFAITLCAERGVSVETCAELMGITVSTCAKNYYKVTPFKIFQEANKAWKGM